MSRGTILNSRPRHSSTIYIDELRTTEVEGEKRELNLLNHRFGNYLDKIKHLAMINANLRRQIDETYRKYMGHTDEQPSMEVHGVIKRYQHPSEMQLNSLRQQINEEVRVQTSIQIRLQRAEYDSQFYQNNMKLFASHDQQQSEQVRTMRQQLDASLHELEQLKNQYERREQDLQMYKSQYNEYMTKLIEFSNEYDQIISERMQNENHLHTLKEQISFEQEFYQRRQEEYHYLEQFHHDFHREFHQNEFHHIVRKIREDYQEFNAAHLAELEILYQNKLQTVRKEFLKREEKFDTTKSSQEIRLAIDSTKKDYRILVEENHLCQEKFEQLEEDLHHLVEQNRQRYEITEREYQQLQHQLPELDCLIVHLRENAVSLWSEINTYRYLLLNLLSGNHDKSTPKVSEKIITTVGTKAKTYPQQYRDETTGFIVHIEDGIIWVRI